MKTITTLEKSFARPPAGVQPSQQAAGAIYFAQKKLGTEYLWGGNGTADQDGRFDCSGLTQAAYRAWASSCRGWRTTSTTPGPHPKRDELLPGDLVFFSDDLTNSRAIRHVGIYVGGGYMIDAPQPGAVDPVRPDRYAGLFRRDSRDRGRGEGPARQGVGSLREAVRGAYAGRTRGVMWLELSVSARL